MFWFALCVNYTHIHMHTFTYDPLPELLMQIPARRNQKLNLYILLLEMEELGMKKVLWRFIRHGLI